MKYLLHIDTSGDTGSVSLGLNGKLVSSQINTESRNHASSINLMIADVLEAGGITMRQLSAVVVCAGPGSYTGLRIGLSTAKGICYALNIPLLLDNKLTLLAYQAFCKYGKMYDKYIPLLLARDQEYFINIFDNNFKNIDVATHIMAENLDNYMLGDLSICLISDCVDDEISMKYGKIKHIDNTVNLDISLWLGYSLEQYNCNNFVNLSTAEPFYLKQVYTHK